MRPSSTRPVIASRASRQRNPVTASWANDPTVDRVVVRATGTLPGLLERRFFRAPPARDRVTWSLISRVLRRAQCDERTNHFKVHSVEVITYFLKQNKDKQSHEANIRIREICKRDSPQNATRVVFETRKSAQGGDEYEKRRVLARRAGFHGDPPIVN